MVLALAAYHNSFSGPFVFDDLPAIRDNLTLRSWAAWPGVLAPPENSGVGGRPFANLTFALNFAWGGGDVGGYHAVNLALHVGASLLLFGVTTRTPASAGVALLATALWTVHPLTTASVSYLSQRTELLAGLFYLLTLYAFLRSVSGAELRWKAVSVAACLLGALSKEIVVTAPVLVLLYDRTFVAGTLRAAWSARRGYYLSLASSWLVIGWLLTTGLGQRSVGFGLGVSPGIYALTECRSILIYVRQAIWPASLVFDYGPDFVAANLPALLGAGVIVVAIGLTVHAVYRGRAAGFAAAAFLLILAPTSSVVPVAEQPTAENRMYLPLAVLVVAGASGLHRGIGAGLHRGLGVGIAACVALTVARNDVYRTTVDLWADTVGKRPQNPRAAFNYGLALLEAGRTHAAALAFERAIHLQPQEAKAHNSLGNALLEQGRVSDALPRFAEAVRLRPGFARAWCNWGTALLAAGDAVGAATRFERAIQLEPMLAEAQLGLGNVWFQQHRLMEAVRAYEAALRLEPGLVDARYNLGSACLELNRVDDAVGHFSAAVTLRPGDAELRNHLGAALVRAGRVADAVEQFEAALRLKPDYADARDNLALARGGSRPAR